jgi:protease-4
VSGRERPLERRNHFLRAILAVDLAGLVEEQRRGRRWSVFFKSLLTLYAGAILVLSVASAWDSLGAMHLPHAALVRIEGAIDANADASAERVIKGLRSAFDNEKVKALVLEIDSSGGSPVQAEMIHREIRRLKALNPEHRIVAVINDTGAYAAYYIAVAADEIYANRASLVGSIGVRMDSLGFTDAMQHLGIERRLYVAADHKGALDMFSPVRIEEKAHIRDTLAGVHAHFIAEVREGRGKRLTGGEEVFSGLFWCGEEALALGLVDGIGDRRSVLVEVLGMETGIDYTRRRIGPQGSGSGWEAR